MCSNDSELSFHAVALPASYDGNEYQSSKDLVFDNKPNAISLIKAIKKSRCRSFSSYDDALAFSSTRVPDVDMKSLSNDAEKQSIGNYKTPIPRELAPLRRAIERGSFQEFYTIIKSNPRFLISSADTAVILMEGPRYNAAHIAAKADKSVILKTLLDTVSNHSYIKQLYPADDETTTGHRAQVLLDCYLNTPDKGACETPLHFASKFGAVNSVELLLSYPNCDITKVNKQEKRACEVVCERKGDEAVRNKIRCLFENQYYVQMIRDGDNVLIEKPSRGFTPNKNIAAVAGPTSPEVADAIFKYLRSPARKTMPQTLVRLSDSFKGYERDASLKCREYGVQWLEYWPFLGMSVDLTSEEGFQTLESHFKKIYEEQQKEMTDRVMIESLSPLSSICNKLEDLKLNSSFIDEDYPATNGDKLEVPNIEIEDEEGFVTAPSSPTFDHCFFVDGSTQTIWDYNAFHAIHPIEPSFEKYPLTSNWMKRISSTCDNLTLANPKNFANLQKRLFT